MLPFDPLQAFHPVLREWFRERFGEPTDVQARAWPTIAEGRHLLATAPTGSGKTLAAFLWSLDRLFTGAWEPGQVRVLYISPLKALNNDIERNLLAPLAELETCFDRAGVPFHLPRVATRSGDTPPRERQRTLRRPPEILITTPESLNILLTSQGGRRLLRGLETVILDEIHAVASGKRGTHLITAVDRLVLLSGEFQRIALSATVRPIETIARWVAGWRLDRRGDLVAYERRPIEIHEGTATKKYEVLVDFPSPSGPRIPRPSGGVERPPSPAVGIGGHPPHEEIDPDLLWAQLTLKLKERVRRNRSTLIFANSRRLAERVAHLVNDDEVADLVYSHHGSLAREIRTTVEEHFKAGKLSGIVATNSLELGIDIGDLDEVVLLQTPFSIASAVQRVGRAGHAVGAVSRGTFYPLFGRDLITATVVAHALTLQDIEEMQPVQGPLDVLAQVILSMTSADEWRVDAFFEQIRTSEPYHQLSRRHFDLVLEMLAGRYADTRLRELTPRIHWNRLDGTLQARRGAAHLIYTSGGTIPDRGYFQLKLQGSGARIGELDEEFVWERKINDRFTLGTQSWRVVQITHQDVVVAPAGGGAGLAPFWRGEAISRDAHLATSIGAFLEWAEGRLSSRGRQAGSLRDALLERYPLTEAASDALVQFLKAQRAATGAALPHRRHLLVERIRDPQNPASHTTIVLHTGWGGKAHRPYALALAAAWEERFQTVVDITHDDDGLMLNAPHDVATEELLSLVDSGRIELLLSKRLEVSGFFGARFRENAGRSLLLPRAGFDRRVPLWLNRQRAKKLLESVAQTRDFPIVLETWRTCLHDEFDLEHLRARLDDLDGERIAISECSTSAPSPFAASLSWNLTNRLMYEDDAPEPGTGKALRGDLLRDLLRADDLIPQVDPALAEALRTKLHRIAPGYAPRPGVELVEWIKERIFLSATEWLELLAAVERDHEVPVAEILDDPELARRLVGWVPPTGLAPSVLAIEMLPMWLKLLPPSPREAAVPEVSLLRLGASREFSVTTTATAIDAGVSSDVPPVDIFGQWLSFYPPLAIETLPSRVGVPAAPLDLWIEELRDTGLVVIGPLIQGGGGRDLGDAENLERLLRLARRSRQPALNAVALECLPHFLAIHQGIAPRSTGVTGLQDALDGLFGYIAPVASWEQDLLPARLDSYHPTWLDSLMQEGELVWRGAGPQRLSFFLRPDLDLAPQTDPDPVDAEAALDSLGERVLQVLQANPPLSLGELVHRTQGSTAELTSALWNLVWQHRITNDTFAAVRLAQANGFQDIEERLQPRGRRASGSRVRRSRWGESRSFVGRWELLPEVPSHDRLEQQATLRERARIVLQRYGVVFRELLQREGPGFGWRDLFGSLRLMELAGEIVSGHFFEGIPGPQFATRRAIQILRQGLPEDLIYWMSAIDPASPCGLGLTMSPSPPWRLPTHHLVYHGSNLVLVSERHGRRLEIHVDPDHPHLEDYLVPLRHLLALPQKRSIEVEEINGQPAATSDYRRPLTQAFQTSSTTRTLRLWRRY